MKNWIATIAAVASLACVAPAFAEEGHAYDNGPVWEVTYITTKPGHFDDYVKFLASAWRAQEEALKAKGSVLDYMVLNLADPRDNEPDVMLMVEWKNMAVFDTSIEEQDAMTAKIFGSVAAGTQGGIDREAIRHVGSDVLTRQLILKPAK